jgi:hypothetical protein
MYYTNPNQQALDQRNAMNALRSLGVATVLIHFSGGNDSGGADSTEALDASGNPVAIPESNAYQQTEFNDRTRTWEPTGWKVRESKPTGGWEDRPATAEEIRWANLARVLEAPIYERWGSFAGEFDVDGTLTWDVAAGTHKLKGSESVSTWQDFEY